MLALTRLQMMTLALVWALATPLFGQSVIEVPASDLTQHVVVKLLEETKRDPQAAWKLAEIGRDQVQVPAQIACSLNQNGTPNESLQQVLATIPPGSAEGKTRKFRLEKTDGKKAQSVFRLEQKEDVSLVLSQGNKSVLAYNYGTITNPTVPEKDGRRSRACYIHPVWGMSGEVLTADFPKDHFHHHGIFWTWPYVKVGDETYDLWMSNNIQQRFVRWLRQETGPVAAVVGVENGWFAGDQQVATERMWIYAFRSGADCRAINLTLAIEALNKPVTLQGRQKKSYGGLTVRFDVWPRTDAQVRVPGRTLGNQGKGPASQQDLLNTPLPWADLTSIFPDATDRSGAAVFVDPNHPDYPPTWLTRTYGALCIGWPGIKPYTIDPQSSVSLDYRVWVHRSEVTPEEIDRVYRSYCESQKSRVR